MVHHPEDIQERTKPLVTAGSPVKLGRKLVDPKSSGFQLRIEEL
jgi:hypothetical protein